MTAKPPLPLDCELPSVVNGWRHDPESNKNGHIWSAPDSAATVGVFGSAGEIEVRVSDDRVSGFARTITVHSESYEHTHDYYQPADPDAPTATIVEVIEAATRWMQRHDPPWRHPDVEEAAFDPPVGYVLDRYYLEQREHIVCYRKPDTESDVGMGGLPPETDPTIETRKYLYVEAWRGSGNATVSLAPWLRAHDDEKHECTDTPDECGLAVALKLAREWAEEQTGQTQESLAAGQSDIEAWST
jgi:hypothetical protein